MAPFVAFGIVALAGCGSDEEGSSTSAPPSTASPTTVAASPATDAGPATAATPAEADLLAVATTYADLVTANYAAAIASAEALQVAVEAFLADPTEAGLAAAKAKWIDARADYGPTEAFRLYDGPIDDPEDGPEGQINAWPLDEAYIDSVDGDASAGIINDPAGVPEITTDVLVAANEEGGETNISTGWHAIEFLLWGQDLDPDGPGARPVTDYTTADNADRRGQYLSLLTQLLLDDLKSVDAQWAADGAYRAEWLADPLASVQKMLRGIGALSSGELAGERMAVAFETKDQEDEHSCFSDNTNSDILGNATGIRMVYLAEYPGISGPSLSSLVSAADPALDAELVAKLDESIALVGAFPATFETMIQSPAGDPANDAFLAALESIEDQGDLIAAAADGIGITISLEV